MLERIITKTAGLEKALDAAWAKDKVIAENLANIDTPGYKRKTVPFEEILHQNSMDYSTENVGNKTNSKFTGNGSSDLTDIEIKVQQDNTKLSTRMDENNVDIDVEMAELAKNSIRYNTLIQRANAEYKKILSVINEGRR